MKVSHVCAAAVLFYCGTTAAAEVQSARARNIAANCTTCHGTNGNSVGGIPPSLAGRDSRELYQTLKEFASGSRKGTVMPQLAKGYSDRQLELVASYFAAQRPASARVPSKP